MNSSTLLWMNHYAPFLAAWISFFTLFTVGRLLWLRLRGLARVGHGAVLTELPAIPLILLQAIGFFKALGSGDVLGMVLLVWWGPGFFATLGLLVYCKMRKTKPNWIPYRKVISWACKLNYVGLLIAFWSMGLPGMMVVYSVWILNDQFSMAFLSQDADRLRRTFHAHWFVRIFYPLGVFWPLFYPAMPYRWPFLIYGGIVLTLWGLGIRQVYRRGLLLQVPDDPTLLRNMMYFGGPTVK